MVRTEIDAIREMLGSKPRPTGWPERRQRLDEVGSIWPVADDVKVQAVDLGGIPGEWSIVPGSDASRALLFFHGGGYCSGSILSHRRLVTEAGRAAGCRTLAVGYRLAPEHPFPAALEDALMAWRFLREQGIAAHDIAVGGDSAGGGLTVALITHLRDAGVELPGSEGLASPSESVRAAADVDPGRFSRDVARRRHPIRSRSRCRRCARDPGSLAAHDPCLATVECPAGGRP
jgi:monoterpene epsilon-lactone hydrolase